MQAGLTAVERGHKVVLVEKSNTLGGTINFTDRDEDKVDLAIFKNMLIQELLESHATVLLSTPFDPDLLSRYGINEVIIAVGASPVKPPIEGIDYAMNALEAYDNIDRIGKNVILAGGGLVGCEVGLHLANHGRNVSVIEMRGMMAYETFGYYRNALLDEMDKRFIKQYLGAKVKAFRTNGIVIEQKGEEKFLEADSLIYSMGMSSNKGIVDQIKASIPNEIRVQVVGDCNEVSKLGDGIHSGYEAAIAIV